MAVWSIDLHLHPASKLDANALAASLATECDLTWADHGFSIRVEEATCKDLRAMWNTRLRGLIATDNVLKVLGKHS